MESDKSHNVLSLAEAQRLGRLDDFIAQEEARGIGPIYPDAFDRLADALIKSPRPEGRTSRSASADGSTGKRTRRGSGPSISR
jgi:hypothetical protein